MLSGNTSRAVIMILCPGRAFEPIGTDGAEDDLSYIKMVNLTGLFAFFIEELQGILLDPFDQFFEQCSVNLPDHISRTIF